MYAWLSFPSPFWAFTFYTVFHGFTWKGERGSVIVICLKNRQLQTIVALPDMITLKGISQRCPPEAVMATWTQILPALPAYRPA